jgi:hypothetical protein
MRQAGASQKRGFLRDHRPRPAGLQKVAISLLKTHS